MRAINEFSVVAVKNESLVKNTSENNKMACEDFMNENWESDLATF